MGLPRSLTAIVQPVARTALGRKRTVLGSLIAAWPGVVGEDIARLAVPDKVSLAGPGRGEGVLVLRVAAADAPTIEYAIPYLCERINAHYGHQAVTRIKLVQRGMPGWPPLRAGMAAAETATAELEPDLKDALAGIEDADLRRSLAALGEAILRREGRPGG